MLSIFCCVNNFTRKKFFMAMLAFEDDSHFEQEAEIAISRDFLLSFEVSKFLIP